jgi:curli biogenesis system outer membrane secretion channel CsgG
MMGFDIKRFNGLALAVSLAAGVLFAGCSPTTTGAVKEDVSLTGQTQALKEAGIQYRGPEYNIAILEFDNKTASKSLGVGEAATDIMRTIVKQAGLEPIVVTKTELKEQERLMELQQSGAVKTGLKKADEGYDSLDYRIAGSVTAYHEVEESSNVLLSQKKTRIARVQVDYSLVDVATGKSLVSDSGMGEYTKTTGGMLGMGSKSTADPGLRDGALRDALSKALTSMVAKLNEMPFTGKVLHVDGRSVTIRAGTRSRVEPGTVLSVYSTGVDLVDPDTGRVIGKREKLIGEIKLAEHQGERISEAEVSSGTGFKVGDVVKVKK